MTFTKTNAFSTNSPSKFSVKILWKSVTPKVSSSLQIGIKFPHTFSSKYQFFLTQSKIPWFFPDLEKVFFPWPVTTLQIQCKPCILYCFNVVSQTLLYVWLSQNFNIFAGFFDLLSGQDMFSIFFVVKNNLKKEKIMKDHLFGNLQVQHDSYLILFVLLCKLCIFCMKYI